MARILNKCRWCSDEKVGVAPDLDIITSPEILLICLRCDTSPSTNPSNRLHAGPPRLPGSKNGWFLPQT